MAPVSQACPRCGGESSRQAWEVWADLDRSKVRVDRHALLCEACLSDWDRRVATGEGILVLPMEG